MTPVTFLIRKHSQGEKPKKFRHPNKFHLTKNSTKQSLCIFAYEWHTFSKFISNLYVFWYMPSLTCTEYIRFITFSAAYRRSNFSVWIL